VGWSSHLALHRVGTKSNFKQVGAINVNDNLQATLNKLLQSGSTSNPALNSLISANAEYHFALVMVGGLFLLALLSLSLFFWRRFTSTPQADDRKWTFEKKTYFSFGLLSVLVGLLMAVVVAANINNVLHPRQEFSGAISMLGTPPAGTRTEQRQRAFKTWLQSGSTQMPSLIQRKIDERLAWQRPKAIISSFLLIVFVVLSAHIWHTLIRGSRLREARWELKEASLLTAGVTMVNACLLLMLMVMGNTQGAISPLSLTLFFG
jgi:hypothetical protein